MPPKQKIKFDLKKLSEGEVVEIDGISFSNIAYILVFVDEVNLFSLSLFQESFLVFKELKSSVIKSGDYLLFTGISGIADDSGWEYVKVLHWDSFITWNISRDDINKTFHFDKKDYLNAVIMIEDEIDSLNSSISLEPLYVIYPE